MIHVSLLVDWAGRALITAGWALVAAMVILPLFVLALSLWAGLRPRFVVSMVLRAPFVVLVLVLSRLLSPIVILSQRDPTVTPAWAWWIVPPDHDIAGLPTGHPDLPKGRKGADPMAVAWWELKGPYKSRPKWVDWVRKTFNIHDTRHWFVRLWQLLRNGGGGAMRRMLGERVDDLLITREESPGRTEYLAYRLKDTAGVGGGRIPIQGAQPVVQYLSIEVPFAGRKFELQIGPGKLNDDTPMGGHRYAKWCCTPRLRS